MLDVIVKSSVNTDCIAGTMVTWFERKDMLERYFKVPSAFKISEYQVFIARRSHPGYIFAKNLSSSSEEEAFNFNLHSTPSITDLSNPLFFSKWDPLEKVPSKNKNKRAEYLKANIIDRYFPNDQDLKRAFFASGQ